MKFIVLPRALLENADEPASIRHIFISITGTGDKEVRLPIGPETVDILRLQFDDITFELEELKPFTKEQARLIAEFVERNKELAEICIINCEAGISRSAAVAAALNKYYNKKDEFYFKRYMPNTTVYRILSTELHKK